MTKPINNQTDFEKLAGKAITLFHLQNVPPFLIPIDKRPIFAIELFNELKKALSDEDKELAMFYLKGSIEYRKKVNEVDDIHFECNQILQGLIDTPLNEVEKIKDNFNQKYKIARKEMNDLLKKDRLKKEKIEKVVNEIKANVIPKSNEYVNLWNKHFWAKDEVEKQAIQKQLNKLIQQIINLINKLITNKKAKTYCIAMYAKLHKMKYSHQVGFKPYVEIINPINNLEWCGSYLTTTEKKILRIEYEIEFKPKQLNQIANYLENNQIEKANDIYNERIQWHRRKGFKNKDATITYSNHKHKSNAQVKFIPLPVGIFPLVFKAFFGADVRDRNARNEPLIYSWLVADLRRLYNLKRKPTGSNVQLMPTSGNETATEYDLLHELNSIESVVIWLQVTGKLDTVIKEFKTGKLIRDKLVKDGHFDNLISKKKIDNNPAKNGGRLSKAINCLVNKKTDKEKKRNHENYPFSYSKVSAFNVHASSKNFNQLGLDKKAKELINNYDAPF